MSQSWPEVNPHRSRTSISRGSWIDAGPSGLAPMFRSIAAPHASRGYSFRDVTHAD